MNRELPAPPPPYDLPARRLILRRQHLLDEIRTPSARPGGRLIHRVERLRLRRSKLTLAVAILVLLGAVGTAVGVGVNLLVQQERFEEQRENIPGEPNRIGPLVEIASGPGWSLVASRSDSGICLDFVVPQSSSGGCGFGVRGEPSDAAHSAVPSPQHWISGETSYGPDIGTTVDGVVAEEVAGVEIVLEDGRVLDAPIIEAPPELQANVDFFLLRVPADTDIGVRSFIAYSEEGQILERRD